MGAKEGVRVSKNLTMSFIRPEKNGDVIFTFTAVPSALSHRRNSPIQGSSADIIKLAMINVHRALREERVDARLILQIHDELIVEASRACAERAAQILRREMENVVKLSVPLTVELQMGNSWYECK